MQTHTHAESPITFWPATLHAWRERFCALLLMAALPAGCTPRAHDSAQREPTRSALAQPPAHTPPPPAEAAAVIAFWRAAGPALWFAKDADFDQRFRERFFTLHEAATRGELSPWQSSPEGALALLILLDQFPRNAFRGTARMYASDGFARLIADAAIARGHDLQIEPALRLFMYLPFAHSEQLADQERSLALNQSLGEPNLSHAKHHHDIVKRFGRFPHRNPILGRVMRPEEQQYLDEGGYSG
jgi:uncharacterized protein (DUF924 family)